MFIHRHPGPYADVEHRDRRVSHDELRSENERPWDHYPMELSAGQLVWVALQEPGA